MRRLQTHRLPQTSQISSDEFATPKYVESVKLLVIDQLIPAYLYTEAHTTYYTPHITNQAGDERRQYLDRGPARNGRWSLTKHETGTSDVRRDGPFLPTWLFPRLSKSLIEWRKVK